MSFSVAVECGVLEREEAFEEAVRQRGDALGIILDLVSSVRAVIK